MKQLNIFASRGGDQLIFNQNGKDLQNPNKLLPKFTTDCRFFFVKTEHSQELQKSVKTGIFWFKEEVVESLNEAFESTKQVICFTGQNEKIQGFFTMVSTITTMEANEEEKQKGSPIISPASQEHFCYVSWEALGLENYPETHNFEIRPQIARNICSSISHSFLNNPIQVEFKSTESIQEECKDSNGVAEKKNSIFTAN